MVSQASSPVFFQLENPAHAIDMPLHDVAAQPIRQSQRALQIHATARFELAQR